MASKRKRMNSNYYDDKAGPNTSCFACNYYLRVKLLLPGKRYCASCAHDRVECRLYHRPLDEHLMDDNGHCRACNAKRHK